MIKKWNRKTKSGALQFAVFIGVLIALLLSGLILYAYTFYYTKEQSKEAIENVQITNSAFSKLLQESEVSIDTIAMERFNTGNQSVKYNVSQWGVFEKAIIVAQNRKKRFVKTAILGSKIYVRQSPTLFLQETYNPLALVGNAMIKGTAFLPSQGVKPGYIVGQSYYGTELIYGQIKQSGTKLPELVDKYSDRLLYYSKNYKPVLQEEFVEINSEKKRINSFVKKTKGWYEKGIVTLENTVFTGNIVIKSDTLIRVTKTSHLKDVILVAPIVEIEEQVEGSFQVIATKAIKVGKGCKLNFPSALVLIEDKENKGFQVSNQHQINVKKHIFIGEGSQIKGCVCYLDTRGSTTNFDSQIILTKEAKITGQVYCMGNFELMGAVIGSLYTKQFITNAGGSVYVNHILNGRIESWENLDYFGGVMFKGAQKTIVKWGY